MPNDTGSKRSLRDAFGEALLELGLENEEMGSLLSFRNENVVVLTADLSESVRAEDFEKKFPHRFIQIGVAEQNMASIAAGLAIAGKIPFITSYAAFSPYGNWSQIKTSICYSNENVKIIGAHSGFSAGIYGATHLGLEDIALTRVLPNMVVLAPCDFNETKKAVKAAAKYNGPVYIRLSRDPVEELTKENAPFTIGKASLLQTGDDLTIVGCGPLLGEVLKAAEGFSCDVINCASIKPLDEETILKSAQKTKKVLTVEEHQMAGGLGGAVCESLGKWGIPVTRIGVKDSFGESGTYEELLDKYGLSSKHIKKVIETLCR